MSWFGALYQTGYSDLAVHLMDKGFPVRPIAGEKLTWVFEITPELVVETEKFLNSKGIPLPEPLLTWKERYEE